MINKSPFQYRIFKDVYRNAAEGMCLECREFINPDSKILDLGCGSGIVGFEFSKEFNSEILGVDIIDNRVSEIPFKIFNGKDLSFLPDSSFDTVLINFVLHHSENPIQLLKEAKRIAKDKIIVYENLPEGLVSKVFCYLHGISFAWLFQKNSITGKFFTKKQWEEIFEKLGLKMIYCKRVSSKLNPMKEELFVLEK